MKLSWLPESFLEWLSSGNLLVSFERGGILQAWFLFLRALIKISATKGRSYFLPFSIACIPTSVLPWSNNAPGKLAWFSFSMKRKVRLRRVNELNNGIMPVSVWDGIWTWVFFFLPIIKILQLSNGFWNWVEGMERKRKNSDSPEFKEKSWHLISFKYGTHKLFKVLSTNLQGFIWAGIILFPSQPKLGVFKKFPEKMSSCMVNENILCFCQISSTYYFLRHIP